MKNKSRSKQENHRRNRRTTTLLVLLLAAALAVLLIAVVPVLRLRHAASALASGDYDTAILIYSQYGTLYSADEHLKEAQYQKAVSLLSEGSYSDALSLFTALSGYRDSGDRAKEAELGLISTEIDGGDYNGALTKLNALDDGYTGKDALIQKAKFGRAQLLAGIGKLENAASELEALGDYDGAKDLLNSVRYNLAIDLLAISDFSGAKDVLSSVPDSVSDAATLRGLLDAPFDGVYQCVYTDTAGRTEPGVTSYLWIHSVIGTGTTSTVLGMQEDFSERTPDAASFGTAALNYVYYQNPDALTWYFSYAGSKDDSDTDGGDCCEKLVLSDDMKSAVTSIVDSSTRKEVTNARTRTWALVTDTTVADTVRAGFRNRLKQDLGMTGNAYFADATNSTAVTHYCCVDNCTNVGTLVAEDAVSRSYYCEEHRSEYEKDSRVSAQEP